ncbi:MAG: glycosyltransferase family 2 protein [Rhodospirillales bacterium]|nr:glycosyltransferase family 2 protein [Rhodospirillales bacterium]
MFIARQAAVAAAPRLSALVVAHNEEGQLAECLERLVLADEIVVVLDRCTDNSASIARRFTDNVIEGGWELEGPRRNTGIEACSGDWILEVDADERVPAVLFDEIRSTIALAQPGIFLVPFDNYIGSRRVRHGWGGSWGKSAAPALFAKGCKRWGMQRVHPSLEMSGPRHWLKTPVDHLVDRDISDMIARLDRYTTARAKDLRDAGRIGSLPNNLRRLFTRFFKCYIRRKGYREGCYGFLIALFAGLFPLLSHMKARLEKE